MIWKKVKKEQPNSPAALVLQKIGERIRALQHKLADRLNARSCHWSRRQQLAFLVGLCGLLAAINLMAIMYLRYNGVRRHQNVVMVARPRTDRSTGPRFTAQDSAAFQAFRYRLDSLYQSPSGRDSIKALMATRPGMLDSMLYVERQIFPSRPPDTIYSQLKNEP